MTMAKAVAARLQGDDYQIRFFWMQVCRLFEDRTKVVSVELESDDVKSLDDVVVRYKDYSEMGEPIDADFYQVKFHVTANGAFTWRLMMEPSFVNANSVSILQRLLNAQRKHAPKGCGCRFNIFSPWTVHPDDELASFHSLSEGKLRWDVLSQGGARSRMGKVREQWKRHMGLATDEDLRRLLNLVRLLQGPMLEKLGDDLNLHMRLAGLAPVAQGSAANRYDDLGRKLIQKGLKALSREDIERICREEGLWVGRKMEEPDAVRIGIRSFWRYAEHLEDETDASLCLLRHFNGRFPKAMDTWNAAIAPEVAVFLREHARPSRPYHIRLQTHGTVAFLAGWELNPKSGVDIVPVQDSSTGRHVWRPETISPEIEKQYPTWQVTSTQLGPPDSPDAILAISATHDIEKDVLTYAQRNLKTAGRLIHCRLPAFGPASVRNGTHAQLLAQNLVASVLALRREQEHPGVLHLFLAAPNGLTFFIGRLAHGLGQLMLYEFDFEANVIGAYRPSVRLTLGVYAGRSTDSKHGEDGK
jgi:hypothetical protein